MTIIITGANRGLGFETARTLAGDTSRTIVLAGRDLPGLEQATQCIKTITGNNNLVSMHLDLASLALVRAFVTEFSTHRLPPLKTIICNAGVSNPTVRKLSADGYEQTFAVNHLGHFLLVHLLLEHLQPPARILLVSSGVHNPDVSTKAMQPPRIVKAEWLAYPQRDPILSNDTAVAGEQAYSTSKLCNLLFVYELSRRLGANEISTPQRPVTVNAFDPGLMAGTGLGRNTKGLRRLMWYYILPRLSRMMGFGRTTAQSGADLAYLATAPELAMVTGKYFSGKEMLASSAESYDLEKAADLWDTSIALSHLQPHESPLLG